MDIPGLFELIDTGAIETYKGEVEVLVDKRMGLVVLSQGERLIILKIGQAMDLLQVMIAKLGDGL